MKERVKVSTLQEVVGQSSWNMNHWIFCYQSWPTHYWDDICPSGHNSYRVSVGKQKSHRPPRNGSRNVGVHRLRLVASAGGRFRRVSDAGFYYTAVALVFRELHDARNFGVPGHGKQEYHRACTLCRCFLRKCLQMCRNQSIIEMGKMGCILFTSLYMFIYTQ